MVLIIVLKVHLTCQKCKMKLMQAVSGLLGIDKIEIDSTKSTLTVTGDVDPVDVIKRTRKIGKFAEVVTIGPPKKPEEKKPDPPKPQPKPDCLPVVIYPPATCTTCHQMDPQITCSVM